MRLLNRNDPHWLRLRSRPDATDNTATNVHAALAHAGIKIDIKTLTYAASVVFGQGLDELQCGYCHHPAADHIWGIEPDHAGGYQVDHFNCRHCARDRDTSLVVCYIRPGGSMARDGF